MTKCMTKCAVCFSFAHLSGLEAIKKSDCLRIFANIMGQGAVAIERTRNVQGESGACNDEEAEQITELELHLDWYTWEAAGDID